jgi:hypothetical protein
MSRGGSCQRSAVSYQLSAFSYRLSALSLQWIQGAEEVEYAVQEMPNLS